MAVVPCTPGTAAILAWTPWAAVTPGGAVAVTSAPRVSWASTFACWS